MKNNYLNSNSIAKYVLIEFISILIWGIIWFMIDISLFGLFEPGPLGNNSSVTIFLGLSIPGIMGIVATYKKSKRSGKVTGIYALITIAIYVCIFSFLPLMNFINTL